MTAAARLRLRLGLADLQRATEIIDAVQRRDRGPCFGLAAHLDETEALALAGVAIGDQLGGLDRAVLAELFGQALLGRGIRQIADIQLSAHRSSYWDSVPLLEGMGGMPVDSRFTVGLHAHNNRSRDRLLVSLHGPAPEVVTNERRRRKPHRRYRAFPHGDLARGRRRARGARPRHRTRR